MGRFDLEDFVAACVEAAADAEPMTAAREVVARAVSDPTAIERSIGHLVDDTLGLLHRSDALTIQHGVFPPGFATGIHDHGVIAVVGTWAGHEDNELYAEQDGRLVLTEARRCEPGDVLVMDRGTIHNVMAPSSAWVAGLHVYLGDLRAQRRREWAEPSAAPHDYDGQAVVDRWLPEMRSAGLVR